MSKNKAKGTAFETDVAKYLGEFFRGVFRKAIGGVNDTGDIGGLPGWSIECKNHAALDIAGWVDQARRQSVTEKTYRFAVVHKRKYRNVREAYVTMPLYVFAGFVADMARQRGDLHVLTEDAAAGRGGVGAA